MILSKSDSLMACVMVGVITLLGIAIKIVWGKLHAF